jgi:plastocyanin
MRGVNPKGGTMTRLAILLSAVALLGAACGGDDGGGGGETTDSVSMVDNEFQPSEFTAASDTVSLTNDGQAVHSFTIPDGNVDVVVQAGDSADADLSGLDAGTFDFECTFHPEMTGSVTVQ